MIMTTITTITTINNREDYLKTIIDKYRIDLIHDCHRTNKFNLEMMRTLFPDLKLYKLQITIDSPYISGSSNDDIQGSKPYDFRIFDDNDSGQFISKEYRGHSTICHYDSITDNIYVFDPILLPWNIAMKGINLDNYIPIITRTFITSKPCKIHCRVLQDYSNLLSVDDIKYIQYNNSHVSSDLEERKENGDLSIKKLPFTHEWFKYLYN
jgi:hypothetical protein